MDREQSINADIDNHLRRALNSVWVLLKERDGDPPSKDAARAYLRQRGDKMALMNARCRKCQDPITNKNVVYIWGDRKKTVRTTSTVCKLCISEGSKASIRFNKLLPRYVARSEKFNVRKLKSEIEWLAIKMKVVEDELERRSKKT